MTYQLRQTTNTERVLERMYATHPRQITFSTFTSFIAVAVLLPTGNLWAAHLVLTNDENNFINNNADINQILNQIPNGTAATLFGSTEVWRDQITPQYNLLVATLQQRFPNLRVIDNNDGQYTASINIHGGIEIRQSTNRERRSSV